MEISDQMIKDLKQIRAYFGENDKTQFEHLAYSVMDSLIKNLTNKINKMKNEETKNDPTLAGGVIQEETKESSPELIAQENSIIIRKELGEILKAEHLTEKGKIESIESFITSITDPENQPNQYGIKIIPTKHTFESASEVMMKYLSENHHPHTMAEIEANRAILWEGKQNHHNNNFLVD